MLEKDNLLNKTFGDLKVIEFLGSKTKFGRMIRFWKCLCICGKEKEVPSVQLKAGKTKSCGCMLLKYRSLNARKPEGYCALTQLICAYKCDARKRKLEFKLNRKEFLELTQKNCYYCNIIPSQIRGKKLISGIFIYNGIDRVDNNKGYVIENCVPCCEQCNRAKLDYTQEQFIEWIKRVYKCQISKFQ